MYAAPVGAEPGQSTGRHHHIPELQSVRGLAALLVVLHHCSFAFIGPGTFNFVAQALLNAHAAVVLFFVLSGFVLTRQINGRESSPDRIVQFYMARAFRIYPALWAALALVALYYAVGANHFHPAGVSAWFLDVADFPPWKRYFVGAALGVDPSLLHSLWSITVELQGSLILPLLALTVRRGVIPWALLQVALVALAWSDWPTVYTRYLHGFGFGAGICLLAPYASRLSIINARVVAGAGACVMLFFRLVSPDWRFLVDYSAVMPGVVEALGAAVLLGVVVAKPAAVPFLNGRRVRRLGDISYSLYLVHLIVLIGLTKAILRADPSLATAHPVVATGLLMGGTVAISYGLSGILYDRLEYPASLAGKALIRRLAAATAPGPRT